MKDISTLQEAKEIISELLKAIEYGELELRTTYQRFTNYKGSSSLWKMQEMLEKYKNLKADSPTETHQ